MRATSVEGEEEEEPACCQMWQLCEKKSQVAPDHVGCVCAAANRTLRYLGGGNRIFHGFIGDFVTSFASSRLASVTRDIREIFRGFGGL
jgi:hypothetical protein